MTDTKSTHAGETRPAWRRFRPGLFPHILLGVLALLSAGCQSDDAGSDLPQETAAENPQPASSSSEQNAAGESVEDQPSKETHFPIRIRLSFRPRAQMRPSDLSVSILCWSFRARI